MSRSRRRSRRAGPRSESGSSFADPRLRTAGVAVIALKLAAVALFFDPVALSAFAVPKATLSSAFSVVLLGLILVMAARDRASVWRPSPVHWPVAGLVVVYVVATVLALDLPTALFGAPDTALGLLTLLDGAVLYAAVIALVRTRTDALVVGAGLFLPILPVTAYAVAQYAGLDPLPWELGYRTFSTFGNSGVLSQYLGSLAVAALVIAAAVRDLERRWRWSVAGLGAIALLGTVLSGTRVALIGFAVTAALVGPLLLVRAVPVDRRRTAALAFLGVLLVGAIGLALTPQGRSLPALMASAVQARTEATVGSAASRLSLYDVALAQIRDRPLFGVGPDNFSVAYGRYRTPEARLMSGSEATETSPHSWVLHVATDAGLIGLAAFIGVAVFALTNAVRPDARPFGLAAVAALTFFLGAGLFAINDAGTEWIPWLAFSVAAIARMPSAATGTTPARRDAAVARALPVAVGVVVLGLVFWHVQLLGAGNSAGRAAGAREAGQLPGAVRHAEAATARAPFRAEYWHELGLALAIQGDFPESTAAFSRAVDLAPFHPVYLSNLSEAYIGLSRTGDPAALQRALSVSERALEADPNHSLVHYTRALVLQIAERPADAAAESERARELAPPSTLSAYQVAARAYLATEREGDALRWLTEALTTYWPLEAWIDLKLLRAQAFIAAGYPLAAEADLADVEANDAGNRRARELRQLLRERSHTSPVHPWTWRTAL